MVNAPFFLVICFFTFSYEFSVINIPRIRVESFSSSVFFKGKKLFWFNYESTQKKI